MPDHQHLKSIPVVTTEFLYMPHQRIYTIPILPGWAWSEQVQKLREQFKLIQRYSKCHVARVRLKDSRVIITVRVKDADPRLWMTFEARVYVALKNALNVSLLERHTVMDTTTAPLHT